MTIRDVQSQMGDNLRRWYPDVPGGEIASMCMAKVDEEVRELYSHPFSGEEMADVIISLSGYASTLGIDLQSEIERKLAIVSARTDQPERDKERGIATDPEPPTLRPGATVRVLKDTKSINGLNLPAGQPLRVTTLKEGTVTARIGEHGEGLVCTVKSGDVEVVGFGVTEDNEIMSIPVGPPPGWTGIGRKIVFMTPRIDDEFTDDIETALKGFTLEHSATELVISLSKEQAETVKEWVAAHRYCEGTYRD